MGGTGLGGGGGSRWDADSKVRRLGFRLCIRVSQPKVLTVFGYTDPSTGRSHVQTPSLLQGSESSRQTGPRPGNPVLFPSEDGRGSRNFLVESPQFNWVLNSNFFYIYIHLFPPFPFSRVPLVFDEDPSSCPCGPRDRESTPYSKHGLKSVVGGDGLDPPCRSLTLPVDSTPNAPWPHPSSSTR